MSQLIYKENVSQQISWALWLSPYLFALESRLYYLMICTKITMPFIHYGPIVNAFRTSVFTRKMDKAKTTDLDAV